MTLRPLIAVAALLAAPVASAADPSPSTQSSDSAPRAESTRGAALRKPERKTPGAPARPRIFDAPGAALMMIPASWDSEQMGGFLR